MSDLVSASRLFNVERLTLARHLLSHRSMTFSIGALGIRTAVVTAIVTVLQSTATAQGTGNPSGSPATAPAIDQEVRAAKRWALLGVGIPLGAGAAFSIATQPGGKTDVPTWQLATLGGLFGFAGMWGVSMGYYRAGRPLHATLSGLGKTALLGAAIALDSRSCKQCDGPPIFIMTALAGIVALDFVEYFRLQSTVEEEYATATAVVKVPPVPYLLVGGDGAVLGIAARF